MSSLIHLVPSHFCLLPCRYLTVLRRQLRGRSCCFLYCMQSQLLEHLVSAMKVPHYRRLRGRGHSGGLHLVVHGGAGEEHTSLWAVGRMHCRLQAVVLVVHGAGKPSAGWRAWRSLLLPPVNSPNPTSSPNRSCSQPTVTAAQDGPGISRAQLRKSHMNHMLLMAQLLCRTAPASAGRSYATSSTARRGARWTAASSRTATPPPSGQQACLPYCLLRQLMVLLACLHALQKVKLV